MNNLTITIEGQAGTGKTTLCQIIEKTLRKEGFKNVNVGGMEVENIDALVEKSYKKRLEYFKNKENFKIEINTKQKVL